MTRKYPVKITMSSDKRQLKIGDALHIYRFARSFLLSPSTPMTLNLLTPMPGWGTTKDENAACHSGLDPESRHKSLDSGSRIGVRDRLRRCDDPFSYKGSRGIPKLERGRRS
jgi:hypothetical protein